MKFYEQTLGTKSKKHDDLQYVTYHINFLISLVDLEKKIVQQNGTNTSKSNQQREQH